MEERQRSGNEMRSSYNFRDINNDARASSGMGYQRRDEVSPYSGSGSQGGYRQYQEPKAEGGQRTSYSPLREDKNSRSKSGGKNVKFAK